MILPSEKSIEDNLPLGVRPPPVHPSIQYGIPAATPPVYSTANKPTGPITYTFSPLPSNAMLLVPPENMSNLLPPYHISISMNCFTPSSYITTIRRGPKENSEVVVYFEIVLTTSKKPSTFCIRGNEYLISDVLESSSRIFRNNWTWKPADKPVALFWDDHAGSGNISCFCSKDRITANLLAKFTPRSHLRRSGRPVELTRLEVFPEGHEWLDDILMSALVVERIRTTPSTNLGLLL